MQSSRTESGLTRRKWLIQSTAVAGGVVLGSSRVLASNDAAGIFKGAESIHQEVALGSTPSRIYEVLTDAVQFHEVEKLSAAMRNADVNSRPARISREAGGAFELFAGYIVGRQVELIPGQRIVQAWRVASWAPGIYSIIRFELSSLSAATRLVFDQIGFPAGTAPHLAQGWHENYWQPMAKVLAA